MKNSQTLALLLFLLALSCTKEIEFEAPFEGEQFVVHAFFSEGDVFSSRVSRTAPPTGTIFFDSLQVDGALVVVSENGTPFDTLEPNGEGLYTGSRYPSGGRLYRLSVSGLGLPAAQSAPQLLPGDFSIEIADVRKNQTSPLNEGFPTLDFHLEIADDSLVENFYFVEVFLIVDGQRTSDFNYWLPGKSFFSADPCQTDAFFFPDICFNGEAVSLPIALETRTLSEEDAWEVGVVVKNITEDYFQYLRSNRPQPEGLEIPFSEPVYLYSNIQGGYGIFGGYSQQSAIIGL
ncbi:MAG: DUF4249 domain-containing protein [Saprospiraceae bacterium]